MGHLRLGELPRTRTWERVIALLRHGASTSQVASATMTAIERGLARAADDIGVTESVWLLFRLPLAARNEDFAGSLNRLGLKVSDAPGLAELLGAVSEAVDAKMPNCKGRTDLGEMAQAAAIGTLSEVVGGRLGNLFGTTGQDVRRELALLATKAQVAIVAKHFFARFTDKCLSYFLSKTWASHVGDGQRFPTLASQGEFSKALSTHCREAARIVEEYAGGWLSKTNWETKGEVTRKQVQAFNGYAMSKLVAELKRGAVLHV